MDVRVLSGTIENKQGYTAWSEQIRRNPVKKNSQLTDIISKVKEQSKPTSLTVLTNNFVINNTAVHGDEDYDSGSNSAYKEITPSPVTPDSDQSAVEKTQFSEQHTRKEHSDTIDGIKFLTFETEYDLNEFTKVEEFKNSEENVTHSDDGLFLDDTLNPDQDTRQGIVLRKTRNIRKVKGWRNKMFAINENCSSDKRTVELDDGFESSDIKVEPGTTSEKHDSLVNWFDSVSIQTNSYDLSKIIKEEIDYSLDVESVPYMDNLMDWKESSIQEPLPKPPEKVPNKPAVEPVQLNKPAAYNNCYNEYRKHAQLSCGLPDGDKPEPCRNSIECSTSSLSNKFPKVATPRIGPKAKTLAEKRRLMNLEPKPIDAIKRHRRSRLKNIAHSKHSVPVKKHTIQMSRAAIIANLDPNYKYVWVEGKPIKIVGSKGALNTKRKIPKPTPQPRKVVGPLARKRLTATNSRSETQHVTLNAVSKASNSQMEITSPEIIPTNSKLTKQTSPAQTPAIDFRAKLRPRKISIIPPTAANHSDFYDRFPITPKPMTQLLSKQSHFNAESEPFVFGIALYPEINRPLDVLPIAHLESLRYNQKVINDDWIKFATSVVTSIESPISPAEKIVLIVSQFQEPNEMAHLIPAKISSLKYVKPVIDTQATKINESLLNNPILCPDKSRSLKVKCSYDIVSLLEDMIDYVELKEELTLIPIRYDPDDDRIVSKSLTAKKKVFGKRKGSALDHELRRLNVNVIDVDEVPEVSSQLACAKCVQEFCRLGCVCSSINATNHAMINHCKQIDCIFQCLCATQALPEDLSTFSPTTVSKIQESTRYLARLEKEFQQTVVRGNDEMFVVKCSNGRHKREIKLPERYRNGNIQLSVDFEMAETKMMSVNNTDPSVKIGPDQTSSMVKQLSMRKNYVEFIPKHTAKRLLKASLSTRKKKKIENMVRYYEEIGVIKQSHVLMFRARGLEDVKILCMVHLMYKCPCDIHPRKMNKMIVKPVSTLLSSPDLTEKISGYKESIYNASTVPESIGDFTGTPMVKDTVSSPLGKMVRSVALKSTTPRFKQLKRQAQAASKLFLPHRSSVFSSKDLSMSSSQVIPSSDSSAASSSTSNPAQVLGEVSQTKSSTPNQTNALIDLSKENSSLPNILVAVPETSLGNSPIPTAPIQRISRGEVSPPRELNAGGSLLCHETLLVPEGICDLTDPSSLSVGYNSTKIPPETLAKPLPLPRWENPSQKTMINHSRRLKIVLSRRREEIQKQILEGDRQLDLNSRTTDSLQLAKWKVLRKRFEDYTLQFWVTTHNNLSCPRLLVTERKNELPNAMCENLRTWQHDHWDDLPPLAIDLITKTPQNVNNDLYGILYYDGTNWELCKQVKRRKAMSSKSQTKNTHISGGLQNEQTHYKYDLLLPKFKVPVRWYTIVFDIKYDFLLLERRIKIPYVHLRSMCEKSAQCGNPCRYSELSSLPKRYFFQTQFGFYADPNHPAIVFLGPFQYTESCDVRMMVNCHQRPGSFYEIKHNNPMYKHGWWYATDNKEETVTLKSLAPPQPSSNIMASESITEVNKYLAPLQTSINSMASQAETKVNTEEESTTMPIITSVVSLRNTPNSDWVEPSEPSVPLNDNVVPSTNIPTKYRTILPNSILSLSQAAVLAKVVDVSTTSQEVATCNSVLKVRKNPVTKRVLPVRLEPSLPHVGHFQANIYASQHYQITLPNNNSQVVKDLKAVNIFLNE